MKRVRLFEWSGGRAFFYQWGRFKRRERNLWLFVYVAWILHAVFWTMWSIWVAPYPIALTVPLGVGLGSLAGLRDWMWPIFNLALLALNTWLIFRIYARDILAAWLLLGAAVFLQLIAWGITFSLIAIAV